MSPPASAAAWQPPASRAGTRHVAKVLCAVVVAAIGSQYLAACLFLWSVGLPMRLAKPLTVVQFAYYYGERSDIAEQGRELARLLPDCALHLIEGAEHGVLFQSTAYLREAIAAWLAKRGP